MSDREDEVRSLAEDLGLHPGDGTPCLIGQSIVEDCRRQVDAWVSQAGAVRSIDQLEKLFESLDDFELMFDILTP